MKLSARDHKRLDGVHGDLVTVAETAFALFEGAEVAKLPRAKLIITEGRRTLSRQQQLVKAGASWTMNSRHLTGHAVDFAVIADGVAVWDIEVFERVWLGCWRPAAHRHGVAVNWGGYWKRRDGPHIELNRKEYKA